MTHLPVSRGGRGGLAHQGFTLIEMLVVVALLAATAAAALLITGQRDQQNRRETTERLMDDIVRAAIGETAPVWSGEARLSGFVVDNGRLPTSLYELTASDVLVDATECASGGTTTVGKFHCHKARAAVFDPTPNTSDGSIEPAGGDEVLVSGAGATLLKGLRRHLDTDNSGFVLRDGWGNRSVNGVDDAANFGWGLATPTTAAEPWLLTSLGANNALDTTAPDPDQELVADITHSVRPEDWSVDIQGWTVRLTNGTGGALTAGTSIGVSLLVWENRASGGTWRRFTTELRDSGLAAGESVDLTFPPGGYPGGSYASTRVPIGEHLLVGVRSPLGSTAHDADDTPLLNVDGATLFTQVRLFPGAGRPSVELVLR